MAKLNLLKTIDKYIYEAAFFIAAGATLSSYVLSHVVELVPCTLCWYQRILMFPLPLILGAVMLRRDKLGFIYALPLALIGTLMSAYHSLLQWGIISEAASTSCSLVGPSCGEPEILWFGFLTIPFGAFLTFLLITVLLCRASKINKKRIMHPEAQRPMLLMLAALGSATIIATILIRFAS